MDKSKFWAVLAILAFTTILFTPQTSGIWRFFLFISIIFGVAWYIVKD